MYSQTASTIKQISLESSWGALVSTFPCRKITIPITLRYENYLSNHTFPNNYEREPATPVRFQTVSLTTGVNF